MNRKMKNTWITKKARYIISLAMVLTLVLQFATPLITFNASAADYPGIVGQTMIVPSTITNQGSYASYNVTGTLEGGVPFSRETFCTHSEFGGGGSAPFVYYWNSDPGETATSNPLFWHNVLGDGGALNDGISMTVEQWRDLRYLILLTRANKWSEGQLVYWAYLGHYMPQKYGSLGA
ncbi:MAG: hypothetical protein LBN99_03110, partial [Oscillospiraceae bacterium]|nr:hypothetical protein [Oscillospiraceae bacterium]